MVYLSVYCSRERNYCNFALNCPRIDDQIVQMDKALRLNYYPQIKKIYVSIPSANNYY